ncbi:hypothetical protein GCM10023162_08180 [Klenkia terrae]
MTNALPPTPRMPDSNPVARHPVHPASAPGGWRADPRSSEAFPEGLAIAVALTGGEPLIGGDR